MFQVPKSCPSPSSPFGRLFLLTLESINGFHLKATTEPRSKLLGHWINDLEETDETWIVIRYRYTYVYIYIYSKVINNDNNWIINN